MPTHTKLLLRGDRRSKRKSNIIKGISTIITIVFIGAGWFIHPIFYAVGVLFILGIICAILYFDL